MDQFWHFVESYWWLVFPLFGMGSAVAARLNAQSKERHKRRLEVLAAKRELKAAEIRARSDARLDRRVESAVATAAVAATAGADFFGPDADSAANRKSEQERLVAEHDGITARWLDYELDVAKLIAFPAMSDGRNDLTAAFLRAGRKAQSLRPPTGARLNAQEMAAYREAVVDYGLTFDVAERDAKRVKDRGFTDEERKRLDRAQQLLKVALDQAATQAERRVAYRRVRDELDGLIVISDDAIVTLEKQVSGELGAGPQMPDAR